MITTLLFDFSNVLLFAKDPTYTGTMNGLHKELSAQNPNYDFFEYFTLNNDILDYLKTWKQHVSLNIFTTDVVQKKTEVKKILDEIFEQTLAANDYGLSKKDPRAYLFIAGQLKKFPKEIVFIDDTLANLQAAEQAGYNTYQYTNNKDLIEFLESHVDVFKD